MICGRATEGGVRYCGDDAERTVHARAVNSKKQPRPARAARQKSTLEPLQSQSCAQPCPRATRDCLPLLVAVYTAKKATTSLSIASAKAKCGRRRMQPTFITASLIRTRLPAPTVSHNSPSRLPHTTRRAYCPRSAFITSFPCFWYSCLSASIR